MLISMYMKLDLTLGKRTHLRMSETSAEVNILT